MSDAPKVTFEASKVMEFYKDGKLVFVLTEDGYSGRPEGADQTTGKKAVYDHITALEERVERLQAQLNSPAHAAEVLLDEFMKEDSDTFESTGFPAAHRVYAAVRGVSGEERLEHAITAALCAIAKDTTPQGEDT